MVLSEGKKKAWAAEGAVKALAREMISCTNPHRKCSILVCLKNHHNSHPTLLEYEVPPHEVVLQLAMATQGSAGMEPSLLEGWEGAVWPGPTLSPSVL